MSISGINIFLVRHYVTLIGGIARGADATSKGKVHKVGNAQTQINNLYLPDLNKMFFLNALFIVRKENLRLHGHLIGCDI
jgi:hypothetical protein